MPYAEMRGTPDVWCTAWTLDSNSPLILLHEHCIFAVTFLQ